MMAALGILFGQYKRRANLCGLHLSNSLLPSAGVSESVGTHEEGTLLPGGSSGHTQNKIEYLDRILFRHYSSPLQQ